MASAADSSFSVLCPTCREPFLVQLHCQGQIVQCPNCSGRLAVPVLGEPAPPPRVEITLPDAIVRPAPKYPRRKPSQTPVFVGTLAAVVGLLCVGIIAYLISELADASSRPRNQSVTVGQPIPPSKQTPVVEKDTASSVPSEKRSRLDIETAATANLTANADVVSRLPTTSTAEEKPKPLINRVFDSAKTLQISDLESRELKAYILTQLAAIAI